MNAVTISTAIQVSWNEVPAIDQNGIITQYEVEYNQTTFSGATMYSTITVDSSTLTVDLTGLEEYVEYSIRVRAFTSVGAGPYSDVVNVITSEDGKRHNLPMFLLNTFITLFHAVPASPPDNVNAVTISSTAIQVTWEEVPAIDQNGIITQYEVEYNQSTFSGATMYSTTTVDSSTLMVGLTGLEEYVEYSIRVRAYTSVGAGPYSDVVMETTQQDGM